ncbi:peptidase inhibitor family I36 protein [Streptomyces smyrnaeus]|uniref:peptidase inhibitor family I36 protein n=1 Tax=Streptomyces smyrnaeus TaxID=1387713 RepID=UPI0033A635DC
MLTNWRKTTGLLVAAGLMTLSSATAASASSDPSLTGKASCPSEYVCVWDNNTFSGKPKWKSKGNLNKDVFSAKGLSILNNGKRYPGGDHIHYKYTYRPSGKTVSGCLHYPGDTPNSKRTYASGVVLNYAQWGGEC